MILVPLFIMLLIVLEKCATVWTVKAAYDFFDDECT